jgi:predicted Zn-dependent protease
MSGFGRQYAAVYAALILLVLPLAGCLAGPTLQTQSGLDRIGPRQLSNSQGKGDFLSSRIDREQLRILEANGGRYHHARLEALVGSILKRLTASSDRPGLKCRVTILNSPTVNAFSLPNGQLYITRGLIALASDASELGSVLSHEMAHVIAGHAAIRRDIAQRSAARALDAGRRPAALAFSAPDAGLESLWQAQELQADEIGATISSRAGYDPYGAARLLETLGRHEALTASSDRRTHRAGASHPATAVRLKAAQVNARLHASGDIGERGGEVYLASIDGMMFGEDPSEGVTRGRQFLQPRLGLSFTAPVGVELETIGRVAAGAEPSGATAVRLDVVKIPADQSLASYLASGWMASTDPRSVRELTINGFPAATATAQGAHWAFRLFAVRFGREVCRIVFAARVLSPDTDRAFRESADTIRPMSVAESSATRPLRLRIHTVEPGETPEAIATSMATDRPLERFLVLNGLREGQELRAGDRVKIVTQDGSGRSSQRGAFTSHGILQQ